jgi:hypothetical protein
MIKKNLHLSYALFFFYNHFRMKKKRKPGRHYQINLALADLLKATFNLPMVIVSSIYKEWKFGKIGNYFKIFFLFFRIYFLYDKPFNSKLTKNKLLRAIFSLKEK